MSRKTVIVCLAIIVGTVLFQIGYNMFFKVDILADIKSLGKKSPEQQSEYDAFDQAYQNSSMLDSLLIKEQYVKVEEITDSLLKLDSEYISWWYFYKALGKHNSGDIEEAIVLYSEAINKNKSSYIRAYKNRALAYIEIGDCNNAVKDIDYALSINDKLVDYKNYVYSFCTIKDSLK